MLNRCDALKRSGMWLPEPAIQPRVWLNNFDEYDRILAASLLERFVFYDQKLTDILLSASFASVADGLSKGPSAPPSEILHKELMGAIFTPVRGERPNPTDSGNFLCRRARQVQGVSESSIVEIDDALKAAEAGSCIVFVDDFIGSGDQFLSTWEMDFGGRSFRDIQIRTKFTCIYVSLVGTEFGIDNIHRNAPTVAVCVTHKIDSRGTFHGIKTANPALHTQLDQLLRKYAPRLQPSEAYMLQDEYIVYGYKHRGLFFGFAHSIPDATLPIFWCKGQDNWEPLIERT
ncbi:MAG: hypothetical protein WAP57_16875 [Aquabacterium commune]|uniref:phosphoribosyltransferase-like protein n=1 Tax=Aquabacterium commune TaxID=70586 RepID=UPI003BAE7C43